MAVSRRSAACSKLDLYHLNNSGQDLRGLAICVLEHVVDGTILVFQPKYRKTSEVNGYFYFLRRKLDFDERMT